MYKNPEGATAPYSPLPTPMTPAVTNHVKCKCTLISQIHYALAVINAVIKITLDLAPNPVPIKNIHSWQRLRRAESDFFYPTPLLFFKN